MFLRFEQVVTGRQYAVQVYGSSVYEYYNPFGGYGGFESVAESETRPQQASDNTERNLIEFNPLSEGLFLLSLSLARPPPNDNSDGALFLGRTALAVVNGSLAGSTVDPEEITVVSAIRGEWRYLWCGCRDAACVLGLTVRAVPQRRCGTVGRLRAAVTVQLEWLRSRMTRFSWRTCWFGSVFVDCRIV